MENGKTPTSSSTRSPSLAPSGETLRHNSLLRRHLADPEYGKGRITWQEKTANGLGVSVTALDRAGIAVERIK